MTTQNSIITNSTVTRSVGIINPQYADASIFTQVGTVDISGTVFNVGFCEIEEPHFDPTIECNANLVLIRVHYLSCNYRDKALIVRNARRYYGNNANLAQPLTWFGSDFVATVVKVGCNVKRFAIGDRVIPNCCYPDTPTDESASGVTTNEGSKGFLILHSDKLSKVPPNMSDEVACGFSIGAQTSTSMVRRMITDTTARVLVTSARSNTSRFILNELKRIGISAVAATSSDWTSEEIESITPHTLIKVSQGEKWYENVLEKSSFDVIFDPYFDLHLKGAIELLDYYGKYITCGYKNQHPSFADSNDPTTDLHEVMLNVMIKNLSIVGNCIGTFTDLETALENYLPQQDVASVDSIYEVHETADFLNKTYLSANRHGKAILKLQA